MKRFAAVFCTVLAVVVFAAPAWAHEEINPKSFSTGQPTFFLLSAANEEKVDLAKITITAPTGVPIGATTKEPVGWTATKTDTAITWNAGAGAGIKPDHFDEWGFETDGADQPGSFTFKATLGFADGTATDVQIPVTVVAGGQPAAGTSTTTGAVTTTTAAPAAGVAAPAGAKQARSRANIALALGGIALVLSLAAMAAALRRSRPHPADGAATKAGQDW